MDQDRLKENIRQDEDASLIKNLVDKVTGPGAFSYTHLTLPPICSV